MELWQKPFLEHIDPEQLTYCEEDGVIICGDCREILPKFPGKSVDLVLTDPPYGNGMNYDEYEDTRDSLLSLIVQIMPALFGVAKRVLVTTGNWNQSVYPAPTWTLAWITPAGSGSGPWGFSCWQPILAYGKDPYLTAGKGRRRDIFIHTEASPKLNHPCPKPDKIWSQILLRGSVFNDDIILDPFLGSGTTAVAAKKLGRRFVGIKISKEYALLAADRVRAAKQGMPLKEYKQGQKTMF